MKKTKKFTQYSDEFINISVRICTSGNVCYKTEIGFCKLNSKSKRLRRKNKNDEVNKIQREYRKNNPNILSPINKKSNSKRRNFGYEPINNYFNGCHFHHTHINNNHNIGIFIPKEIHTSISHNYKNQESMNKINKLAFEWWINEIN